MQQQRSRSQLLIENERTNSSVIETRNININISERLNRNRNRSSQIINREITNPSELENIQNIQEPVLTGLPEVTEESNSIEPIMIPLEEEDNNTSQVAPNQNSIEDENIPVISVDKIEINRLMEETDRLSRRIKRSIERTSQLNQGQINELSSTESYTPVPPINRELLIASNNWNNDASNFLQVVQNQNRWVLFGLGVAFILVAGVSYFLGYRRGLHIGRENLTTILPNNRLDFRINQDSISSTNEEHKKRVLKIIWNLLVDRFKFKK